jgi:hypothetical protein
MMLAVKEGGGHVALGLSKLLREMLESVGRTFDLLGALVVLVDWEGTIFVRLQGCQAVGKKKRYLSTSIALFDDTIYMIQAAPLATAECL